jgi:hypothetical protein
MNDDPSDVKQVAGEEASIEVSSTEEPKAAEEVETPVEEATVETTEETQTETVETPKKGAQSRIRELNSEKKRAEDRANSLEAKLAELTGSVDPQVPQAQFNPQIEPGGEYSPDQYKQDVLKTAEGMVNLKIKQSEAVSRIRNESNQAVTKFPELDPESDSFNRELSDSITEATEAYVRANPYTASPLKFVEKMMKPYQRAVTKEVGKERENIAKQVSQSATRPTSVSTAGGKSDQDKSISELEKELGIYY